MKLLFEYTLDFVKRNRRSSMAVTVAVLMASTMLSALCGFLYNIYDDNLNYILRETGNWHGELFDDTPGGMLPVIEGFESVEAIMIKGSWKTARIEDPRRGYLVWRDANEAYWNSMPEGDIAISEGRAPAREGEIALSKQYFEYHPELKLGDDITLPLGRRVLADGSPMEQQSAARPGEYFVPEGTVTLTVVGRLDAATSSTVPAYTALGFLEREEILPEDDLTVYLRFRRIRDTYKELPKIAAALGYEPDEYGNYELRYNTEYLTRKAVLSPEQRGLAPKLLASQMPLMFLVIGLLTAGLFVLIIKNAFTFSSSARLSQLGIFASVGASPRQIKRSVIMEALVLTAFPLPLGVLLGQLSVGLFIHTVNGFGIAGDADRMVFTAAWQSVLPAVLLTVFTVWWSALIPAKKAARMSPIDAIRQSGEEAVKVPGRFSPVRLGKLFGLSGELAANALWARKRSYRTAAVSLTLSFLTLACFLCIDSASSASRAVYRTEEADWAEQDIVLSLYNVATPEDYAGVTGRIAGLDGVEAARWHCVLHTAVWLPEERFSGKFKERGGFDAVEKHLSGAQIPLLRDGKRRVNITVIGLDDKTFDGYCSALGVEKAPFYEKDRWRGILYHTVNDVTAGTKRSPAPIPFFDIEPGESLTLTEAVRDSCEGDFTFDMEAAAVADRMPPLGSASFGVRYSAVYVIPIGRARELAGSFANSRMERVYGVLQTYRPDQISTVRKAAERICESSFGSGDYMLLDENEHYADEEKSRAAAALIFEFVAGVLAVIGLSNVWATIRNTLNARRREFAILRSVGLPPGGVRRMLFLEALMTGLTPVLAGLPLTVALQGIFLSINEVAFIEWLPFAPWPEILTYIAAVLAVTSLAYIKGGTGLLKENIIETVRTDSI